MLSWGVTGGSLSEDEVRQAIERALADDPSASTDTTPEAVLERLCQRALLFKVPGTVPPQYRSRFAEALRLTAQLRQVFQTWPSSAEPPENWWQKGKRLVADYRLHTAPRRYPKRDVPPAEALGHLSRLKGWSDLAGKVAAQQIGARNLSRFQVDATEAVFRSLRSGKSRGVIVGAGTGSGKTLAFYLPAFAAMAEAAGKGVPPVQTLAIYPRVELLRDQVREALSTAEVIADAFARGSGRPLRLGALYADTLWRAQELDKTQSSLYKNWRRVREGWVCPYLTCPRCAVGDLVWRENDRRGNIERLVCAKCGNTIPEGRLALTRDTLLSRRPDLLFATAEMLNRHSANPELGSLLGWLGGPRPSLVLLDEVHTYSGIQGAQVALLLRRWRHAAQKGVTFVGLSATLKDAEGFFAQLTGLSPSDVQYIQPAPDAMEEESREYAIALRGDPTSGTSLLSTSIQTAMLFGRFLVPKEYPNDPAAQFFGSTGFVFTDDLDVTNRFYNDLRDAEGKQSRYGKRLAGGRTVLAALRSPDLPQHDARYRDGQSWDLVTKIGHHLDRGLTAHALEVGRTSSQDTGVSHSADLIVATASLEVGFNDPRVGLVLQHKAPYDSAAFLQRRGRAGRRRGTRPVTIVVLSDYGRDRLAYQGYESLFAPELQARSLPVGNRYVLKIQAAQVFIDWLGRDLRHRYGWADARQLLSQPWDLNKADSPDRSWLADRIESLLRGDEDLHTDLARYLERALQVDADEVQALLWEQPRSLLLGVAPTALRRLRSKWRPLSNDPGAAPNAVLPEFITRTLFDSLNLPEVTFDLPFGDGETQEHMPVAKALREAVPGRVSRRYGHKRDDHRTWLPIPDGDGDVLELEDIVCEAHPQGEWRSGAAEPGIQVIRPDRIQLSTPPDDIADRSQGRPLWATEISGADDIPPSEADVPDPSPWRSRVMSVAFATHVGGNAVEVRRLTYGADCEVSWQGNGGSQRRRITYTHGGRPTALGFTLDVDAMRIRIAPLDSGDPSVQDYLQSPEWRSKAFFRTVAEDPRLAEVANTFQRDWLALIYLTAFSLAGLDDTDRSSEEVLATLANGSWRDRLDEILRVLYREGDETAESPSQVASRLSAALTELSHDPVVIEALDRAGQLLVAKDVAERTAVLAHRAYADTLAAAILDATLRACPDAQDTDIIVDVEKEHSPGTPATIWLSETSIGGLGVIENLVRFYSDDPRRFWSLVRKSLQPNEYEYVDATLTRLLQHVVHDSPSGAAAKAVQRLRAAQSAEESDHALRQLRDAWTELDGPPQHSAIASLSTRLLRPGSGPDTDAAALGLVRAWDRLQQRLGIEIDARIIAYTVGSGKLDIGGRQKLSADQAFSVLWPRGERARNHHLEHYQPFLDRPMVLDRLLLEAAYDERLPRIDVTDPDWQQRYQEAIADAGAVELSCPTGDRRALSDAVARIPALAVDRDVMRIYGEVEDITRYGSEFRVRVELREAEQ
nr:protein DpdJ [Streptomonospora nanhaiensis]